LTDAALKYTMLGVGYNFYTKENVKFIFHYNVVMNETTNNLIGFNRDVSDNILTIRMQYRFYKRKDYTMILRDEISVSSLSCFTFVPKW